MTYIVEGGVFRTTDFTDVTPGTEERYGPFNSYDEALDVWGANTWRNVDVCEHRLFIKPQA